MDAIEDCASCRVLYESLASKFTLTVSQSPDAWTQEFCVGLVDLARVSPLQPIDVMALDRCARNVKGEGHFSLVVHFSEKNGMCLGILHAPGSIPMDAHKGESSSIRTTQKSGQKRVCLHVKEHLANVTREATSGHFYYDEVADTNLGYIASSNPREHQVFELTSWLNALTGLQNHSVLNVWCYANANASVLEKRFAVEVIADCKELKPETKRADARLSNGTGISWLTVSIVGVITSSLLSWILSFTTHS